MSDHHDNTNKGALFPPYSDQRLLLSGKIDVEGDTGYFAMIKRETRDGAPVFDLYQKVGVMFSEAGKEGRKENSPDYSGPLDRHPNHRLAAWKQEKDGRTYLSLRVSRKQDGGGGGGQSNGNGGFGGDQGGRGNVDDIEDEIPF
jgi:hypothetical protein